MRVCVVGHHGFLGSRVFNCLGESHEVTGHGHGDARDAGHYDVLVNCAGLSSRPDAEADGERVEREVLQTLAGIDANSIVQVSSIDAWFRKDTAYGRLKWETEQEVIGLRRWENWHVLRPAMMIGLGLKKCVVKDLHEGLSIQATAGSTFNIVSTDDVSRIVALAVNCNLRCGTYALVASESIRADRLAAMLGRHISTALLGTWRQCNEFGEWPLKFETSESCVKTWLEHYTCKCPPMPSAIAVEKRTA